MGWIAERFGARASLGVGASAAVLSGVVALAAGYRRRRNAAVLASASDSLEGAAAHAEPVAGQIRLATQG